MKTLESNAANGSKTEYQVVIEKTGEVCKTLTVDEHDYATGERFWKLYDKFFDLLCDLDCSSSRVLAVAISNVVPKYNTFGMSIRKLSAEAESNEKAVTRALKLLEEKDIIVTVHAPQKRKNGEWMLNPRLFVKATQIKQLILEGQYDECRGLPVSPYGLVNSETGEVFCLPEGGTPETVNYQKKENFLKAFRTFPAMFSGLGGAELKLMSFVLKHIDWARNDIHFTLNDYARCYKTHKSAVSRSMKELRERDFMIPFGVGRWMVNPGVIMKGNDERRGALKSKYKKAKQETEKAAEQRKAEREKKAAEAAAAQSQQPVPALEVSAPESPASQKIPIPGGGLWPPRSEEKTTQNKFVPFIPAAMQRQMAEEKRKREEETPQESIDISTVPYDDGESDEYVPLEYVEAGAAMLNDDDEDDVRYIKDDDDLPF